MCVTAKMMAQRYNYVLLQVLLHKIELPKTEMRLPCMSALTVLELISLRDLRFTLRESDL